MNTLSEMSAADVSVFFKLLSLRCFGVLVLLWIADPFQSVAYTFLRSRPSKPINEHEQSETSRHAYVPDIDVPGLVSSISSFLSFLRCQALAQTAYAVFRALVLYEASRVIFG